MLPDVELIRKRFASEGLSPQLTADFSYLVQTYYREFGRQLPWRQTSDPYRVLVSECMLQQTQVDRVLAKYSPFIKRFPDIASLAEAPLPELLPLWQGLGYNRRLLSLQRAARIILTEHNGSVPSEPAELTGLPGIGPYTAGAIAAFAFDKPVVFIETNIRAVYLHYFFPEGDQIPDSRLIPLIAATLDHQQPRNWYNGLMDLGAAIKKVHKNPSRRSAHHTRQSPFQGSDRQLRGEILKLLVSRGSVSQSSLTRELQSKNDRLQRIIEQLMKEGFVQLKNRRLSLVD